MLSNKNRESLFLEVLKLIFCLDLFGSDMRLFLFILTTLLMLLNTFLF